MPKGYMLTAEAVRKIKADHESLRLRVRELEGKAARAQSQVAIENLIYVKISEIVTPAASGVLGSGKAIVQEYNRDDYTVSNQTRRKAYGGSLEDREIDVYNESQVPVFVGAIVACYRDFKSGLWILCPVQTAIGKAPNGISARSGSNAGTGQVDIYYLSSGVLTYSGYGLVAYNIADSSVAGGSYVMIKRNSVGDNWFVDMAECD